MNKPENIPTTQLPFYRKLIRLFDKLFLKEDNDLGKGFNLIEQLNHRLPIIEIGGPTPKGYPRIFSGNYSQNYIAGNPILITNILPSDKPPKSIYLDGKSTNYPDNSVGCIIMSCIPYAEMRSIIDEAYRILKPGGFLIIQATDLDIWRYAAKHNFLTKIKYHYTPRILSATEWSDMYDLVLEKC